MEKDGGEKSVELVRPFWMQKRYHSADVVQTLHLGAQGCFLVKITVDEITVLLCGDSAHPVNPDTTRMADHLAHHMLRHLILVTADRKVDVASLTPVFTVKNFSIFSFFYIHFNPDESRFFIFTSLFPQMAWFFVYVYSICTLKNFWTNVLGQR